MQTITLNIQQRETGKKAVKAVRNAGLVPCVLYGSNTEPIHFSTETLELRPLINTSETYLVSVTANGEEHECILKSVDFHPITDMPIHVDFQALTRGEAITVTIPIQLVGMAAGVKDGGNISQPLGELEIRCLPKDIPGHISIDVSGLEIGDSLHVSDLAIPEQIDVLTDDVRTVVTVSAPRIEVEPEAEEGLELLGEDGEPMEDATEGEEGGGDEEAAE